MMKSFRTSIKKSFNRLFPFLNPPPEVRLQRLFNSLDFLFRISRKNNANLLVYLQAQISALTAAPTENPAAVLQLLSENLGRLIGIFSSNNQLLIDILQRAVWKEFIVHLIKMLVIEKQPLLQEHERRVSLSLLEISQKGSFNLAVNRLLSEALQTGMTLHANPGLARLTHVLMEKYQVEKSEAAQTSGSVLSELTKIAEMHGILAATATATSDQDPRSILIAGLARYGLRFARYVTFSAVVEPALYERPSVQLGEIVGQWARGRDVTRRADEPEARARYFLDGLKEEPRLARLAANQVQKLPPGHPLREGTHIKDALNGLLHMSITEAFSPGADLDVQIDTALSAMAGLIEHQLVTDTRIRSLLDAGQTLLKHPDFKQDGGSFRQAAIVYLSQRASEVRENGEVHLAERYENEGREIIQPLVEAETDPTRKLLYSSLLHNAKGDAGSAAEDIADLIFPAGMEGPHAPSQVFAAQFTAKRSYQAGNYPEVIALLEPVRAILEDDYLGAVLEADVSRTGQAFSDALILLAFAYAKTGVWENALIILDRCKSLRFRYQAQIRAGPLGELLRELEADIHARERGVTPPEAERLSLPTGLTDLIETYRQTRVKAGMDPLISPSLPDLSASLESDEALIILGSGMDGFLVVMIRSGKSDSPETHAFLPIEDQHEFFRALTDPAIGWLIAINDKTTSETGPRPALTNLIDATDRIFGRQLAGMLKGSGVRRVTIIPHLQLHLVPFWALPSLENYEVMTAPSAAQFLNARQQRRHIQPQALIVGNPTADLKLAEIEAQRVAYHLNSNGVTTLVLLNKNATEEFLTQRISGASIFHFSGHGHSDTFFPTRSALEVHPGKDWDITEEDDLLRKLAAEADWQPVYKFSFGKWINDHTEGWLDLGDRGRLVQQLYSGARRIDLRLEHSAKGTLLAQYAWLFDVEDDADSFGQRMRLAELWTAGDLLTEGSLAGCDLVFLSSCKAGSGGLGESDEFAGLPAAFQLGGAATIISPLWPVSVEAAALFTDQFYSDLTSQSGEIDILTIVKGAQLTLRSMDKATAAEAVFGLAEEKTDRIARLLLHAAGRRILDGDEEFPFSHPYDWAAFQVTGAPVLSVPFAGRRKTDVNRSQKSGRPPHVNGPERAENSESVPTPDMEDVGDFQRNDSPHEERPQPEKSDVFILGKAAEILIEKTGDEKLIPVVTRFIFDRGLAYERAGNTENALADYLETARLDPTHVQAYIRLSALYAAQNNLNEALANLDKAITLDPGNVDALIARSKVYRIVEQSDAALADLDRAVQHELNEDQTYSYYSIRGGIALDRGDYEAGEEHYTKALAIRPEDGFAFLYRALAFENTGRHEEAEADANRGLLFYPDLAIAYQIRGDARSSMEKHADALSDYDRAISSGLDNAEIYVSRGLEYAQTGQYDAAIIDYSQALARDPENYAALFNRACAYSLKHEAGSIVRDLTEAFTLEPPLIAYARDEQELKWAVEHLPEVRRLIYPDDPD